MGRGGGGMIGYRDLSGRWLGKYAYDGGGQPVAFEAVLTEEAGFLHGETLEPNSFRADQGLELAAVLAGVRDEGSVSFVKTYLAFREEDESRYEGQVDAALCRIEGHWWFPLVPSVTGRFVMMRDTSAALSRALERAAERAG